MYDFFCLISEMCFLLSEKANWKTQTIILAHFIDLYGNLLIYLIAGNTIPCMWLATFCAKDNSI
jgi:hypothetical protein